MTSTTATILALLTPGLGYAQAETLSPRLVRMPAVSGKTVVFAYAGDLWVGSLGGGTARRLTSAPGNEVRPKISPDGKTVAFTANYDGGPNVYTVPIEGGEPKRLTYSAEPDNVVGWTPDGKIAFASSTGNPYLGRQQRLWLVSPNGGRPEKTVLEEFTEGTYFPSGKRVAYTRVNSYNFNWRRYRGGTQGRISLYSFPDNRYEEIPAGREQSYFPMVVGDDVYYVSDRDLGTLNLFRYRGGKIERLTDYKDADIRFPSTDGKTIVWERDGRLFAYDIATDKTTSPDVRILSENLATRPALRPLGGAITSWGLSPSGVRLAVEARGEIFSIPVANGDTRNLSESPAARERFPTWSNDGASVYYLSDADGEFNLYKRPARGGEATRITNNRGTTITSFELFPDGKTVLYTRSDYTLWTVPADGGIARQVFKFRAQSGSVDISPDGRWLALIDAGANNFGRLKLVELATGKVTFITDGYYNDQAVVWDQNGKYLYLTSSRTFEPTFGDYEFSLKVEDTTRVYVIPLARDGDNPLVDDSDEEPVRSATPPAQPPAGGPPPGAGAPGAAAPAAPAGPPPIRVDLDGMGDRLIALPLPAGGYPGLTGLRDGFLYISGAGLLKFDLNAKQSLPIVQGPVLGYSLNPARTKVAYRDLQGVRVADVRPGAGAQAARVDTAAVQAVIDPVQEWKQIYWEAWRWQRDYFYDPNFNGVDWNAVGKRYATYLDDVKSRSDLNVVLGQMIGELGTGHAYVTAPGDLGPQPRNIPVGHLGADYEAEGGKLKFARIFRGNSFVEAERGPLAGTDVKEGEFLLAIDGKPVDANVDPRSLLLNAPGRFVTLTVAKDASGTGKREVRVSPIATETTLRYVDYVEANRRKVSQATGGRVGYFHVRNTAAEGAQDFVRGFYPQTDKDGLIVDERWNGGGYIQPWFVDTLARRTRAGIQVRNAADSQDAVSIDGPKVMLVNGYAGSGGDFFPWMFRQQGLGPLVGKRTWGGLVGISGGAPLVDGGGVTAPGFAIYDYATGRVIAENTGVDPDVDVDARPDLVAKGRDPQLERAIEIVLEELKKRPAKKQRSTVVPPLDPKARVGGR